MIVLPNSFERYLASLRIFVSLSILKHGLQLRHLRMLKKITSAEAFYNKNSVVSLDIYKLCTNLLRAAVTINPHFKFEISEHKTRYINKAIFTLLLLNIAQNCRRCKISANHNQIIIKTENITNRLLPLISALDGYYLREIFINQTLIIIPAPETKKPSAYIESEWELIFDRFSIVNIFFENIRFG